MALILCPSRRSQLTPVSLFSGLYRAPGGVYRHGGETYQVSDMSQTYPLMRGTAPLLVALISVLFLGDSLSSMAGSASRDLHGDTWDGL